MCRKSLAKALSMGVICILTFCTFDNSAFAVTGDKIMKDNTYTGKSVVKEDPNEDWKGYTLDVSMGIENGKFKSINLTAPADMERHNRKYVNKVQEKLNLLLGKDASENSLSSFDGVSGATFTFKAVNDTVKSLVKNAPERDKPSPGGDPSGGDDYVYGTVDVPYADYYFGELNPDMAAKTETMDLTAKDKVAPLRAKGHYDSVTSATKKKASSEKFFGGVTYWSDTGNTVEINGVKAVKVKIKRELYEKALKAIENKEQCNNPLLDMVKNFKKTDDKGSEQGYKTLGGDGTLSKRVDKLQKLTPKEAEITTLSRYGNYEIELSSDKMPKSNGNVEAVVMETSDGKKYGLQHLENIWHSGEELAFAVRDNFVEPHGNKVDYEKFADMEGKEIKKITYLVRGGDDLEFAVNLKLKKIPSLESAITIEGQQFKDGVKVIPVKNIKEKDAAYVLKDVYKGREKLVKGTDYTLEGENIVFKSTDKTGVGRYRALFSDGTYGDLESVFDLNSEHKEGSVYIKDNKLVLPEGLDKDKYFASIQKVLIDDKLVKARDLLKAMFNEDLTVNFDAKVNGKDGEIKLFTKGAGGKYNLKLDSAGYPDVDGELHAPGGSDSDSGNSGGDNNDNNSGENNGGNDNGGVNDNGGGNHSDGSNSNIDSGRNNGDNSKVENSSFNHNGAEETPSTDDYSSAMIYVYLIVAAVTSFMVVRKKGYKA